MTGHLLRQFELTENDLYEVDGPVNLNRLSAVVDLADRPDLKFLPFTPGIIVREPYPDWTGYEVVRFQVYSALTETRPIVLWIEDEAHNDRRRDRYEHAFKVVPGLNDFSVPLESVRDAPAGRQMALDRITFMMLFTRRPTDTFELYLGDVWLE